MGQDLRSLADEDVMQLVRRGDARAFEVIYDRHSPAAFSLAYRMMGTRAGAEDVTQEAFLSMWRSGARYDRARGSVRTWVLGIVHHRAIDALRRPRCTTAGARATRASRSASRRASAPTSRPPAARRRGPCATRSSSLPADQCQVIELAYFGGFTHTEIADMLDAPVGTVKGRMRLGLKKMRAQLGEGQVAV